MKINLGCGWKYRDGWTNVDKFASRVDVRADIGSLPFDDGTADHVDFYHTIEHVPRHDGVQALREIHRVLKRGGTVAIETPDRMKLIALINGDGPKTKRLNVVEGTRVATGLYYPNAKPLLHGVKGALGGVSGTPEAKADWHRWLLDRRTEILAALEAGDITQVKLPKNVKPGEPHLYIWHAMELVEELQGFGFTAKIEPPQSHGARTWRDSRVVGVKR